MLHSWNDENATIACYIIRYWCLASFLMIVPVWTVEKLRYTQTIELRFLCRFTLDSCLPRISFPFCNYSLIQFEVLICFLLLSCDKSLWYYLFLPFICSDNLCLFKFYVLFVYTLFLHCMYSTSMFRGHFYRFVSVFSILCHMCTPWGGDAKQTRLYIIVMISQIFTIKKVWFPYHYSDSIPLLTF